MKTITLIATLTIWAQIGYGQIVPSSCSAPDSIISKYIDDADRLALRRIYRNNLTFVDSVFIPQQYSDTVLNALIAVYNATTLPARDTVTTMYDIHSFPDYVMNNFYIRADSNLAWMQELQNGNLTTGNPTIDNVITTYGLSIYSYYASPVFPTHLVVFETDSNYNLPIITNDLDTITGVLYAEPNGYFGDGNNIWDSIYTDHVELIYSLGWGDCPSGCTSRRNWKFNVYFDCSVEFVESYGTPLSLTGITDINRTLISVYPNPMVTEATITLPSVMLSSSKHLFFTLYDRLGRKQAVQYSINNNQLTIKRGNLPGGIYFYNIISGKQTYTGKLAVQ